LNFMIWNLICFAV